MTDEKIIQNGAEKPKRAKPRRHSRASIGKIACFPHQIREELNLRLFNGQRGPEILPWLNELPAVKEILAARFAGAPVNDQNFSNWRKSGYRCWLNEQKKLTAMKNLGEYATGMAVAAGENISRGAAVVASGNLSMEPAVPQTTPAFLALRIIQSDVWRPRLLFFAIFAQGRVPFARLFPRWNWF